METESQVVAAVKAWLQLQENMGKLYWIRNNSGAIPVQHSSGTGFLRFGRKGSSDFIVFFKGGRTEFWECKTKTGRLSLAQEEFQVEVEELGFVYRVIRSLYDVQPHD